ncbi:MAG: hypothetical protein ACRCUY_06675 [Thermoguttaceae bacterium]
MKKIAISLLSIFACTCIASNFAPDAAFAELPSNHGQVWQEFPLQNAPADRVIEIVKNQTGNDVWNVNSFGMINYDNEKLYVYHNPQIQNLVRETIERFNRPQTKDIEFTCNINAVLIPEDTQQYRDIIEPILPYIHPVLDKNGNRAKLAPSVSAYYVEKKDVEKFHAAMKKAQQVWLENSQTTILVPPRITIKNGENMLIDDTTQQPYVSEVVATQTEHGNEYQPVISLAKEGRTLRASSLLSWDGKSVTSDVYVEFSKISSMINQPAPIESINANTHVQCPKINSITVSATDVTWPSDGLLLVIRSDARMSEGRKEIGTPWLNKIPYVQRWFTTTVYGREVQMLHTIVTIEQADQSIDCSKMLSDQDAKKFSSIYYTADLVKAGSGEESDEIVQNRLQKLAELISSEPNEIFVEPYMDNLSLVICTTEQNHAKIAKILVALRQVRQNTEEEERMLLIQ